MKKLMFLLLITPIIGFAQLKNGRYFIKLMNNGKNIQTNSNSLMLADGCADFTCSNQYFDIATVPGSSTLFTIKSASTGRFLTFSDLDANETTAPAITLETLKPTANRRFQQFLIVNDKDGVYSIHPNKTTRAREVFLATELRDINNGGTQVHLEYKTPDRNPANYSNSTNVIWSFVPIPNATVTRTPVATPVVANRSQSSPAVIVAPPSNNKLEVDIRTGGDNLEPREHQENPSIIVEINGQPNVVFLDINKNQNWVNNSFHRVTIPLPANVNIDDLKSITISRKNKHWGRDEMVSSDNWTVANVAVTASLNNKRTPLANYTSARPNNKVFRFMTMTNRGETGELNKIHGWGDEVKLPLSAVVNPTPITVPATDNVKVIAVFGTGGDDLRGGNDNINVYIRFKSGRQPITLNNFNGGRKWDNFSEKSFQKIVPNSANVDINDISDVMIRHTGGGGIGADNWYLDKLKLSIQKGSETRVLIDRIEAPIHYFTGDNRSKTFQILR